MLFTPRQTIERIGIDLAPTAAAATDETAVLRLAQLFASTPELYDAEPARWDDPAFWNVEDTFERRSQFLAVGNAINFRFWTLRGDEVIALSGTLDGTTYAGSMYLWRSLRRAIARDPHVLDAAFLAELTDDQFDSIFADDGGTNPIALAGDERILNLRDLGRRLVEDWSGQFLNAIEASDHSIVAFSRISRSFRAFDDPMQKLTMVNAIMHAGSGIYTFEDEPLPGIDYQIVKQLVRQGVVVPAEQVASKLQGNELLDENEAIGLRSASMSALVALSNATGVSGAVLDNRYWLNRTNCTDDRPVCTDPSTAERCPFLQACDRRIENRRPLELTRYY
jgi:hypothetical protein